MWYWHPTEAPGGYRKSKTSIQEIRRKYGSERIYSNDDAKKIEASA